MSLDGFDGPFEKIDGLAKTPPGKVAPARDPAGYLLSHSFNDAFNGTTKLLAAGEDVYWLKEESTVGGKTYPAGTIYIPAKPTTAAALEKLAVQFGLSFDAAAAQPRGEALQLRSSRIGLWDRYGGSVLVPRSFGQYGHYRGNAIKDTAALPISYAGHQVCESCHDIGRASGRAREYI